MNWQLVVAKSARKALKDLPAKDRLRVERALDALQRDPFSGDIKRLEPPACWELSDILRPVPRTTSDCGDRHQTAHHHDLLIDASIAGPSNDGAGN